MNQKIENLLRMSLEASESERIKAPELGVGYEEDTWELIIKYAGDLERIKEQFPNLHFHVLQNNYAVVRTSIAYVEMLAHNPHVEYVEKPKRMFFQLISGKRQSCITRLQEQNSKHKLFGQGVIVAVIDSGINAADMEFRNIDGTTRILEIWDQSQNVKYNRQQINEALDQNHILDIPGKDASGHGTKVAAIACGNHGVASKADILVVKMGIAGQNAFPRTTQLMQAIDYIIQRGVAYAMPVAINISFGNNYGDHCGSSLLERYINDCTLNWKCVFCVGSGNETLGATHTGGWLSSFQEQTVELAVGGYETSVNVQIWKDYWDECDVELITPAGKNLGRINYYNKVGRVRAEGTTVLMLYGQPSPYSIKQEIYIELIPDNHYIAEGIWRIRLIPQKIRSGRFDMWLPSLAVLNQDTGFFQPDNSNTCTVPSTADRVISVGAYDSRMDVGAAFSGRGYIHSENQTRMIKPELVAPGVEVAINISETCTGTSCATPFVTGSAALLMEWGIVRGEDPFLYGEKVKAYLIKGARQLPGFTEYPDPQVGWGALCVADSLPG